MGGPRAVVGPEQSHPREEEHPDWRRAHRMVITRYTRDGQPALARPCPVCARVIDQAGIKIIEHT
jgi:hypothetical protein